MLQVVKGLFYLWHHILTFEIIFKTLFAAIKLSFCTALPLSLTDQCTSLVVTLEVLLSLLCRPTQFLVPLFTPPLLSPPSFSSLPFPSSHWCRWWVLPKLGLTMTYEPSLAGHMQVLCFADIFTSKTAVSAVALLLSVTYFFLFVFLIFLLCKFSFTYCTCDIFCVFDH